MCSCALPQILLYGAAPWTLARGGLCSRDARLTNCRTECAAKSMHVEANVCRIWRNGETSECRNGRMAECQNVGMEWRSVEMSKYRNVELSDGGEAERDISNVPTPKRRSAEPQSCCTAGSPRCRLAQLAEMEICRTAYMKPPKVYVNGETERLSRRTGGSPPARSAPPSCGAWPRPSRGC